MSESMFFIVLEKLYTSLKQKRYEILAHSYNVNTICLSDARVWRIQK